MAGLGGTVHAQSLSTGGQVVGGSATISQTSATQMQITSMTARSAISWQDFSIGAGYGVNVTQPAGGTQLEQVRGTNVSQIFGSLTSNGNIVIANPNGIWFGPSAQVDVAGLAATTAHATATDIQTFVAGGSVALSRSGNANAAVVNQGTITVSNAGLGAFVAPGVRNDGVIQAKRGTVQLSSGTTPTLDFYGDRLISIAVNGQTLAQAIDPSTGKPLGAAVTNTGTLNADGGTVLLTANVAAGAVDQVINTSGVVQARAVSVQGGQIVLDGGSSGTVQIAGNLDASGTGAGQTGGSVKVLGNQVALNAGTKIDVAGDAGGGTALVGGNFHGAGPERNAQTTYVDADAVIDADAVTSGNGGEVAVWSDQATGFNGTITARGGSASGNGGQVETSGAQLAVGPDASVSTAAPAGKFGTWLLDPKNLFIGTSNTGNCTVTSCSFAIDPKDDDEIEGATIDHAASDVILQANTDITVAYAITMRDGVSLTLNAGRSIVFKDASYTITLNGGSFTATINDENAIADYRDPGQAVFNMNGASITTGGSTTPGKAGISITTGTFCTPAPCTPDSHWIGDITLGPLNTAGPSGTANYGGPITVTNDVGSILGSARIDASGAGTGPGLDGGTVDLSAAGSGRVGNHNRYRRAGACRCCK